MKIIWVWLFSIGVGFSSAAYGKTLQCQSYLSENNPQVLEQVKIFDRIYKNDFFVSRNFDRYSSLLSSPQIPPLIEFLKSLNAKDIYLDAGAGEAKALVELIRRTPELELSLLQYVAVALKRPGFSEGFKKSNPQALTELEQHLVTYAKQFRYIDGDLIENLVASPRSGLFSYRNKISLITDIYGPFSYTSKIEDVLLAYASLLKVGGNALIHFYDPGLNFVNKTKRGTSNKSKNLEQMSHLISELTQGRLEAVVVSPQHEGKWPQTHLAILWLKKVSDSPNLTPQSHIELKHIYDEAPPIRTYEVSSK